MSRALAYTVGFGLLAAIVSPALSASPKDSYPLSTYPMFSQKRRAPVLYFAEGVDAAGTRSRVPPELVANDEVMQAAAVVKRAVLEGSASSTRLCESIARRAANHDDHVHLVRIELVGARFDPVGYFVNGDRPAPEERTVHQACGVKGTP